MHSDILVFNKVLEINFYSVMDTRWTTVYIICTLLYQHTFICIFKICTRSLMHDNYTHIIYIYIYKTNNVIIPIHNKRHNTNPGKNVQIKNTSGKL